MSEFAKLFLGMGTLIAAARTGLRKTLTAVPEPGGGSVRKLQLMLQTTLTETQKTKHKTHKTLTAVKECEPRVVVAWWH